MIHPVDAHVGRKLRQVRMLRKITQNDLSKALGVSPQQVQKYEQAKNRLSASKLYDSAMILGVRPEYFFEGLGDLGANGPPIEEVRAKTIDALPAVYNTKLRKWVTGFIKSVSYSETPSV